MQQDQILTRELDGRTVPLPGEYDIDPSHTTIEAVARHLMVAKVRGRFTAFSGVIEVADSVVDSSVEVSIDASSIDTGEQRRDGHLRSADFLDTETYPTITFRSTGIRVDGDDWLIDGEFTMRGVARPVTLRTEFLGAIIDHRSRHRILFSAQTELDREEFGMTWNQALEAGGVVVGPRLKVNLEVQALRREPDGS